MTKTYIELLETVLTELKREVKHDPNTHFFICNSFCKIAYKNGNYSYTYSKRIFNDYPQLEKWITKIGKQHKPTFIFGDAWVTLDEKVKEYKYISIPEKIRPLKEYIKELKK